MRKNLSFLFFILLLMLSINSMGSGDITTDSKGNIYVDGNLDENAGILPIYNSTLDNITPNYQIIPIVDKRTINGGEGFTISYQISGNGKVVSNKLITYFPIELLKEKPTYYIYIGQAEQDGEIFCVWYDQYPNVHVGSREGAFISLVNATFRKSSRFMNTVYGEEAINGHRPIKIEAVSSDNAPTGDNTIKTLFVYSDGENWYSSQCEVTIHIREWYEKIEIQLGLILFTGLILVLFDYYLRKRKSRKNNSASKVNHQTSKNDTEKRNGNPT